ncbi:MAG: hypothetical protein ACLU0O_11405 [Collinsella sp.]
MTEVMAQTKPTSATSTSCRLANDIRMLGPARQQGKERLSAQFHAGAVAAFGP